MALNPAEQARLWNLVLHNSTAHVLSRPSPERGAAFAELQALHYGTALSVGYDETEAWFLADLADMWTRALVDLAAAGRDWRGGSA